MPGTDDRSRGSRPSSSARAGRRLSRRRVLTSFGVVSAGLAASVLVGCDERPPSVSVPQPRASATPDASVTAAASPTPSIRRGGTWRMALPADPGSLDPYAVTNASASAVVAASYSRLLAYEAGPGKARVSFNTVPDAAEFTQAPDARTFIVRLNSLAKFTAPVSRAITSTDVKHSYERAITRPDGVAASEPRLRDLVEAIETPDERTVTFRLKRPHGAFPQVLADARGLLLVPRETGQAFDPARRMAGSGPFVLQNYEATGLTYTRNAAWHLGPDRPFIDGVSMSFVRDASDAVRQFLAGSLDTAALTSADVKRVREGVKGVVIDQTPPLRIQNITFSGLDNEAPWRDVRVRRAVSMAINRDAMLDESFGLKEMKAGGLDPVYTWDGFLPWGITGYSVDAKQMTPERLASFKFNLSEASRLLSAAGWSSGFGVEWHYTGGFRGGYPLNARLVAQHLREVNINLRTTVEDYGEVYLRGTVPGNFRGMASISQALGEPGNYLEAMYLPGSRQNSGRLNDPRLTELVQKISGNTNHEERRQQILDVQGYLADQMLNVPLPNGPMLTAYQPSARNVMEYQSQGVSAAVDQLPYYWKA